MAESAILSSELNSVKKSELINDDEISIVKNQKQDVEEKTFFKVIMEIQSLDILISLPIIGCYTPPYRTMFPKVNFYEILRKLSNRQTTFSETRRDRKYRNSFGFYGYNILKLFERNHLLFNTLAYFI